MVVGAIVSVLTSTSGCSVFTLSWVVQEVMSKRIMILRIINMCLFKLKTFSGMKNSK
jgi:hypothetical protein